MKLNEYQNDAVVFQTPAPTQLVSYGLGVTGEAGEVADLIKKHVGHGHPLDVEKLKLELGDVLWYVAGLATVLGLTLEDVAAANIAKLTRRYPNGFSTADSLARRDVEPKASTRHPDDDRSAQILAALHR